MIDEENAKKRMIELRSGPKFVDPNIDLKVKTNFILDILNDTEDT